MSLPIACLNFTDTNAASNEQSQLSGWNNTGKLLLLATTSCTLVDYDSSQLHEICTVLTLQYIVTVLT